jgi:3-oxoacyl-(acyl-carrier-protein) synthase
MIEADCNPCDIDLIVPFGSGIPNIDAAELEGLTSIFGEALQDIPTIITIPYTGNCMAGNGAICVGVAAKAIKEQMVPARIGTEKTNGINAFKCNATKTSINRVLVVTPSEGGQCVAIILGRIDP